MNQIVENTARKLLRQLYSQGFQLRGINSPTSDIFVAEFLDDTPPVLMKIPRAVNEEALREQRILDSLEGTGIPVPQVLYTQENFPAGGMVYITSGNNGAAASKPTDGEPAAKTGADAKPETAVAAAPAAAVPTATPAKPASAKGASDASPKPS